MAGGAVTADDIAHRIEAALARIETSRANQAARDSAAGERLKALQKVVEASVGELDALIAR